MNTSASQRPWHTAYEKFNIPMTVSAPDSVGTLIDYFEYLIAKQPDAIAFTCLGQSLDYRALDAHSKRLAAYLQTLGLQRGDKIAIMMPNLLHYPVAMMAVIRAGFVLVNINPLYTPRELAHQLNDSDAKVLIVAKNFLDTVAQARAETALQHLITTDMQTLGFVSPEGKAIDAEPAAYQRPDYVMPDDVALLQYTGGTTGVAKGAMLTHRGLIHNVYQLHAVVGHTLSGHSGYILTALPLYHIFAFSVCVLFGMQAGLANLLIPNPRDLPGLIDAIQTYKPILIPAVNTLFNAMLASEAFCNMDHGHVKLCVGGGMAILSDTAKRWQEVVGQPIIEGCGLSETGTVISVNPPAAGFTASIGVPLPMTDIKLLDDDGNICGIGQAGMICVQGVQVMKGYYKREHLRHEYMTPDGYFKTGDIGIMDADGFIKIIDRKKDVVNVSGFNVYPSEIENVYASHPDVLECCAVGVPDPHSHEAVKLFVVKRRENVSADDLREWGRAYLTGYKLPKHIEFIDEIPKSTVGKLLRKNLRS